MPPWELQRCALYMWCNHVLKGTSVYCVCIALLGTSCLAKRYQCRALAASPVNHMLQLSMYRCRAQCDDVCLGSATPFSERLTSGSDGLDLTRSGSLLALARHIAPKLILRAVSDLAFVSPAMAAGALLAARFMP